MKEEQKKEKYVGRYAVKRLWTYRSNQDRTTGWQVIDLALISTIEKGKITLDYSKLANAMEDNISSSMFNTRTFVVSNHGPLEEIEAKANADAFNERCSSHEFLLLNQQEYERLQDIILDSE